MSKKKKNNKLESKIKIDTRKLAVDTVPDTGDDEFIDSFFPRVLTPTAKGKTILDEIERKKNLKLEADSKEENHETVDKELSPVEVRIIHTTKISEILDKVISMIADQGKYGKALDLMDADVLKEFVDAYTKDDINNPDLDTVARKLINIGKSFYEYDDKHRQFISDETYDGLLAIYKSHGNIEPSGIIPKGKKNLKKVSITYPTLHNNMDKAYAVYSNDPIPNGVKEKDCIEKFLQRVYKAVGATSETEIELELSPKIDGVSLNGTVVKDLLRFPQTRGDSEESVSVPGMDGLQITTFKNNDEEFGIQYELFVTEEDRIAASKYLGIDPPYVSCRHAAAGLVSRLATKEDSELFRYISLYPIMAEGLEGTYPEIMDYLQNFGVVPKDMPDRVIIKGDMKTLLKKISKQFQKLAEIRPKLSFAIDGMVITVVDQDYQKTIGREGRTNQYQIALKFDPASAAGIVKGMHLDTGRKGYRTIQIDLEDAVFLDGVRYDHVPVLSVELFKELGLHYGSEVLIHRTGDVIPAISLKDKGDGKVLKIIDKCPTCGESLIVRAKKLYCANPMCKDNIIGRIMEFMDKIGMTDYGESFAELVHEKLGVDTLGDLFVLINEDTISDSGINSKKLREFPDELRKAVSTTADYKVIGAMGIPGIGPQKAKGLLKLYDLEMLSKLDTLSGTAFSTLDQNVLALVGPTTHTLALNFLTGSKFHSDIKEILPYIKKVTKDFNTSVVVGHSGAKPTKEVEHACELMGWELTDGRKFDMLLVPSHEYNSTKVEIAKKKELPIMTTDELINMAKEKLSA